MSRLAKILETMQLPEGFSESGLAGVRFFKAVCHKERAPLLYDPGISIVAQGHKLGYLGERVFRYDNNNYLVVSVAMPFECETFATPESPLLGIYIDVDISQLHELISQMGQEVPPAPPSSDGGILPQGIGPAPMEPEMADATVRLVKCLRSETEARVLGPGLVREVLFRVLGGPQAPMLHALATYNGNFAMVARALKVMQAEYAEKLDVERLAGEARMSASAFHRAFREVTADSPMQYLKKVRLNRARDLILQSRMKAYIAADKVGYESASQFSREFKRYFGKSPAEMMREARAA